MDWVAVMLAVGFGAMLAQAVLTRELLAVCSGNELTIGVLLGLWLGAVALGAWWGRQAAARLEDDRVPSGAVAALAALAVWVPLSVALVRAARWALGVGAGEYLSLAQTAVLMAIAVTPVCLAVGGLLPPACEALARRGHSHAVSRLYVAEAAGAVAGGAFVTFVLVGRFNAWQIMALGGSAVLAAAALVAGGRTRRLGFAVVACLAVITGLTPYPWDAVDFRTAAWRWRVRAAGDAPPWRLVASVDTRHQNLALIENAGQYTLYGNGQVLFSLADPIAAEHGLHPIMAQHPTARRVLVMGGNPTADLPELLKHPVERVVYVELDEGVIRLLRGVAPALCDAAFDDPRVTVAYEDGPLFVLRTRERFDLVIIRAPDPVSGASNRLFTREFYESVRACLSEDGVVWTSLEASERLEAEARRLAASVYRTLATVFDVVRVTAGSPMQFVAGSRDAPMTLDRGTLCERSRMAGIATRYYRPEYLLVADELDPAKVETVERQLRETAAPVNTMFRPVVYRQALVLWSRFSGSGLERVADAFRARQPTAWIGGAAALGAMVLLACIPLRRQPPVAAMAAAGFGAVTLEVVLLYLVQGIEGYLYTQFGLLVALFMGGTVVGAHAAGCLGVAPVAWARRAALGTLLGLAALASGLALGGPSFVRVAYPAVWIGLLLAAAGALVAAMFVAVARLLRERGVGVGGAAAWTDAADYAGSMLGGLLGGTLLVPLAGIAGACGAVALLCVLACLSLIPTHRG